ncbi:nuclear pore complex subunit [Phlyctema vagabunda]|uniref:Nuclear pore complex subunit n=1 Tax=Phlyctema vagabunda TaxID=108571 RepID=A0ABR4PIT8_9HELO
MAELNGFERLELLQADLKGFTKSQYYNPDRLIQELEARNEEFRGLLDKKSCNAQSRQSLATGQIKIDDTVYTINDEFQQGAIRFADEVDLDELAAAEIFFEAQHDAQRTGRTVFDCAIIRFYLRRKYILEALFAVVEAAGNVDLEDQYRQLFQSIMNSIVRTPGNTQPLMGGPSKMVSKCLSAMNEIRPWIQKLAGQLADRMNSASVLGQQPERAEIVEFQRSNLVQQHEILGLIMHYLIKSNLATTADFRELVDTIKKTDKYDNILLHYFPALAAYVSQFGAPEGGGSVESARELNQIFTAPAEKETWKLPYVYAAFKTWWLAEHSGWYGESYGSSSMPGIDVEAEAREASRLFTEALKEGAFDFLLSLSADIKPSEIVDPARHGLRQWLQRKSPMLLHDSVDFSPAFQAVLMDQLESFVESFITNLPDVARKLKIDENEQRQLSQMHEHDLDLERFLVIISYTFENRPKASMDGFWAVPDGALLGFIVWASKRASTPLITALCEMLQALSGDEECATAAHEFLLDEGLPSAGKMNHNLSLTWGTVTHELEYFCDKIRNRPAVPQSQAYRSGKASNDPAETEPESVMMLECYLRLITQLCTQSGAARQYLLQHQTFRLEEMLFQLASSSILPRLRACAFTTLGSLLSHKTRQTGDQIWHSLDSWICGGYAPSTSSVKGTSAAAVSSSAIPGIFQEIGTGFEQPKAFIDLLNALMVPYEDEVGLNDSLPFPENLGHTSRMPSIDPYIDFAVGQIFGGRLSEGIDSVELRLLQLSCLDFIETCLLTFNEDLVIFANKSNVSVDKAINTSDLNTYVRLHPFSRVMEWMFSDNVMSALFKAVHQNQADIGAATPESPLFKCLLRGIEVITLVMDLQSTFLDIIRPVIRSQSSNRRHAIANAAYTSFEDGVLNHLFIILDLGQYCSCGHDTLTAASLKLLEKLSASPKLACASTGGLGRRADRNKAIAILESSNDTESIARSLANEIEKQVDVAEVLQGFDESYDIKLRILGFLVACIQASPNRPTIAHVLLGFQCSDDSLLVESEGLFAQGTSLFHSILNLVLELSSQYGDHGISSVIVNLKHKGLEVLRLLWMSPLSSRLTLNELDAHNALINLFVQEPVIQPEQIYDGLALGDPGFVSSESITCLSTFLSQRAIISQYISAQLRRVKQSHSPSLKQRAIETLLGSTTVDGGAKIQHATIFDHFDFMECDLDAFEEFPQYPCFTDIDFRECEESDTISGPIFSIRKIEELLQLRQMEIMKTGNASNVQDFALLASQAHHILNFFEARNRIKLLGMSRFQVLRAWVQLMLVVIDTGDFDNSSRISFVLQALQTIMPRLEHSLGSSAETVELAQLAKSLIFNVAFASESLREGDLGDLVSDRLFHLFQFSLQAICSPHSTAPVKELCYIICYRYLTGMTDAVEVQQKHSIRTIKGAGERLIDRICDDAYAGEQTCRIAALLLLGALVKMGNAETSKYMVDSLSRLNFISILVNSLETIPRDLQDSAHEDVALQLTYCNARLALLLFICHTRPGATAVVNAGLFHVIKESGLFSTDPDLGTDIDDPDAIAKHYSLLVSIMRVICAAVLSRGSQNEQTVDQGRRFLTENRLAILAVFKQAAGLGSGSGNAGQSIEELADSFMVLISATGFIDFEEKLDKRLFSAAAFT